MKKNVTPWPKRWIVFGQIFKHFIFIALFTTRCSLLFGQEYVWHQGMTGSGSSYSTGNDVVTDASGNVYVVGIFSGTIGFGTGSLTSASITGDIFFVKYNSNGSLAWQKKIGQANASCNATGAALYKDASNNIFLYISGYFTSNNGSIQTVDFEPLLPGGDLTMSDAAGDAFVAKYNVTTSNQLLVWATKVSDASADFSSAGRISVDASGNAYVARTIGVSGAFLRKYNSSSGAQDWSISFGLSARANDVSVRSDLIYVAGTGLSSSRPFAWYTTSGALSGSTGATDRNMLRLTLDNSNGIYGVGDINNSVQDDFIIEKYTTTASSSPVWNKLFYTGVNGSAADISYGGAAGDIMVTGWFKGSVNFNSPLSGTSLTSSGSGSHDNIFVARYYASGGAMEWVKNNTANATSGQSNPIALTSSGTVVHVVGFILNRTVNLAFCGTSRNVAGGNNGSSYVATYTQRLFAPIVSGPLSTLPGETEDYSVNIMPGAKGHDWFVPPGWIINYYGNPPPYGLPLKTYMFTSVGTTSGNVAARAVYDCGNSLLTSIFVTVGSGGHFAAFYPNPASNTLAVDLETFKEPVVISLIDSDGYPARQTVFDPSTDKDPKIKLDTQQLKNGLYFLQLATSKQTFREHITVAH